MCRIRSDFYVRKYVSRRHVVCLRLRKDLIFKLDGLSKSKRRFKNPAVVAAAKNLYNYNAFYRASALPFSRRGVFRKGLTE